MNITTQSPSTRLTLPTRIQANGDDTPPPPKPKTMVDQIVDKTYLGANFTACALTGGVTGTAAGLRSAPETALKAVGAVYPNLWKTEVIGPNLKIIGSVVAAPVILGAVALGLPISLMHGIYKGADQVDSSIPRQFTVGAAATEGYGATRTGWEKVTKGTQEAFAELGAQKLAEGEKPLDIPLIKTAKTLAVGAAAVAVGGVAGVVSGVVGGLRESLVGIGQSLTDSSLSIPGRLLGAGTAVLGGAVHGAVYGVSTGFSILGQGLSKTWKEDSLVSGGKTVFSQAYHSMAAAGSPQGHLLQDKQTPPQG